MRTLYLKLEVDELISGHQCIDPGTSVTLQELMDAAGSDLDAEIVEAPPAKKPRYLAVLSQSGGCDYTIGCGINTENLQAESLEEALTQAEELLEEHSGERALEGLTVYEVSQRRVLDVKNVYAQLARKEREAQMLQTEEAEKAQLQKLLQKHGVPR